MKKSNILLPIIFFTVLVFISTGMAAQPDFGNIDGITFDLDVNDEPVTPIFSNLILMLSLIIGSIIGYTRLAKK